MLGLLILCSSRIQCQLAWAILVGRNVLWAFPWRLLIPWNNMTWPWPPLVCAKGSLWDRLSNTSHLSEVASSLTLFPLLLRWALLLCLVVLLDSKSLSSSGAIGSPKWPTWQGTPMDSSTSLIAIARTFLAKFSREIYCKDWKATTPTTLLEDPTSFGTFGVGMSLRIGFGLGAIALGGGILGLLVVMGISLSWGSWTSCSIGKYPSPSNAANLSGSSLASSSRAYALSLSSC